MTVMSRQRLFTLPGITVRIVGAEGLVTSTMPSPQLRPMRAYSRPEEDVYPQQSAPLAPEPGALGKEFRGIHVFRLTFLEMKTSSAALPMGVCVVVAFHASGEKIRPQTAGCLSLSFLSSSSA